MNNNQGGQCDEECDQYDKEKYLNYIQQQQQFFQQSQNNQQEGIYGPQAQNKPNLYQTYGRNVMDPQQYQYQQQQQQQNEPLQENGQDLQQVQINFDDSQQLEQQYEEKTEQQEEKQFLCPKHQLIIEYIIVTEEMPKNMSRFACLECRANLKIQFSLDCCLLADLKNDFLGILKFTNKDLDLQRICNLYHKNEPKLFPEPEIEINRLFNQFEQLILYRLDEMRKTMIAQAEREKIKGKENDHKNISKRLNDLKQNIGEKIPTQQLFKDIDEFVKADVKDFSTEQLTVENVYELKHEQLFAYQLEVLESKVNEYVQQCLYKPETTAFFQKLSTELEKIQNDQIEFYNINHLKATFQKMLYQLDQLKYVFQDRVLRQSELSDNFINKILTQQIAEKGKLIYRSSRDQLNYIKIQELSPQFKGKSALYIFETFTNQTFGVYFDINKPLNSLLFHMTRRHKYPAKIQQIVQFNDKANSAEPLFIFGREDLVISANMVDCTSNLGEGFNTELQKEFITETNRKRYLANTENFSIKNMEILVFE